MHRLLLRDRHRCRWHRGPLLFGTLIENASGSGDITGIAFGYFIGAALMIAGGVVEAFLGVKAERQALEDIATPLTVEDSEGAPKSRPANGSSETVRPWAARPS